MKTLLTVVFIGLQLFFGTSCSESSSNDDDNLEETPEMISNSSSTDSPMQKNESTKNLSAQGDVLVTDPVENAFSIRMPAGWKNEAYLYRVYDITRTVATSASPDGRTVLFIGDPKMPEYIVPDEYFNEQSPLANINPLSKVAQFIPAEEYFENYVNEKFGKLDGFRVTGTTANPVYKQIVEDSARQAGMNVRITDAGIKFEYKLDGELVYGLLNGITFTDGNIWIASVNGITSTEDPAKYNDLIVKMIKSSKTNEQWKQQQQRFNQERTARLRRNHENNMAQIHASNERHQIRMNGIQEANRIQNETWKNTQASNDRKHERFLNVIREENTVVDSSGTRFQVDNSHQKYFVNKQDKTYIGTHGTTSLDDLRRLKGVDPNDYEEVKIIP